MRRESDLSWVSRRKLVLGFVVPLFHIGKLRPTRISQLVTRLGKDLGLLISLGAAPGCHSNPSRGSRPEMIVGTCGWQSATPRTPGHQLC